MIDFEEQDAYYKNYKSRNKKLLRQPDAQGKAIIMIRPRTKKKESLLVIMNWEGIWAKVHSVRLLLGLIA